MREENYRDNKNFEGDKDELFRTIAQDYGFGDVVKHTKVQIGYEDDNNILETTSGTYFVKIFGAYRNLQECNRYIEVLKHAIGAGVPTPKLYLLENNALHTIGESNLAVFEYIDGHTFYELDRAPSEDEAKEILGGAASINQIDFKPSFINDDWAIVNILEQYKVVENYLSELETARIKPLVEEYKMLDLASLPHCLVHGDIIATNVIKDKTGKINIVDFACSNYCPRIIELAVLSCNLLSNFSFDFIVQQYEVFDKLTDLEHELLPFFANLARSMHVIGAVRERDIYNNKSSENKYLLAQGHKGLKI